MTKDSCILLELGDDPWPVLKRGPEVIDAPPAQPRRVPLKRNSRKLFGFGEVRNLILNFGYNSRNSGHSAGIKSQ